MADAQGSNIIELRFKAEALGAHGLPDMLYPLPTAPLDQIIGEGGELPFALMLHGLQQASAAGHADWQSYEPAMARLAELIAPADERARASAAGEDWWIEIGAGDLAGPIVTIQRGDRLVAAMAAREDGRLRLAAYRPLDGKSAGSIIAISRRPHPDDGTVCMRANNWEYAKDCAAGIGQVYAAHRGEAHLAWWGESLGYQIDGNVLDESAAMIGLQPRPPAQVAVELGVAYAYS